MLNCVVALLIFIYIYANFRAVNSEWLLYLVCFLEVHNNWLSPEETELKLQGGLKTNVPNEKSVPVPLAACSAPCSCPVPSSPTRGAAPADCCPAVHVPGLPWSHCCMGCDCAEGEAEGEESSGCLFTPAWVFGGRCLLQETNTPGSVLKWKQGPGHDQGQPATARSWMQIYFSYLQCCCPLSFALQCLVQAP